MWLRNTIHRNSYSLKCIDTNHCAVSQSRARSNSAGKLVRPLIGVLPVLRVAVLSSQGWCQVLATRSPTMDGSGLLLNSLCLTWLSQPLTAPPIFGTLNPAPQSSITGTAEGQVNHALLQYPAAE
jgi:hypothetical protein